MNRRNNFHHCHFNEMKSRNTYYNNNNSNKNYKWMSSGGGTSKQFPSNRSPSIKYNSDNRNIKFTSNLPSTKKQYNLQAPKYISNAFRENQNSFNTTLGGINDNTSSSILIKPSYVSTYVKHNGMYDSDKVSELFKFDNDSKHTFNQSMQSFGYKLESTKPLNMFSNNSSQSTNTFQHLVNDKNKISEKSIQTQSKYTYFNFGSTKTHEKLTSQVNFGLQNEYLPSGNLVPREKNKIGIFQSAQSLIANSNTIQFVNNHSDFKETLNKDSKPRLVSSQSTFDSWVKQTYGESNSLFWSKIVTLTPATWNLSKSTPLFESMAATASNNSAISMNIKDNDKNPFINQSNSFPPKDKDLSFPLQSPPINDNYDKKFMKPSKVEDKFESSSINLSSQSSIKPTTKLELNTPESADDVTKETTIQLPIEKEMAISKQETTILSGKRIILKRVRRMR